MRYYTESRTAEEYRIRRSEENEHIRRCNETIAIQPGSQRSIELWNAGKMPVFCEREWEDRKGRCVSGYIQNGECWHCDFPCKMHARNIATGEQAFR